MTEPLLRGPRAHSVSWWIDDDWIQGTMTCNATEGADCRLMCPEGCESWDVMDHEHPLVDQGKCNFVQWMEAEDMTEAHVGSHALVDGFVTPEWDGDHYVWSYSVVGQEGDAVFVCREHQFVVEAVKTTGQLDCRRSPGHRNAGCSECDQAVADAFTFAGWPEGQEPSTRDRSGSAPESDG